MTMINEAMKLAGNGWPVFPVNGKIPLIREWPDMATVDSDVLAEWWRQWPQANMGIVTGSRSGLLILDIDGPVGETSLQVLTKTHGALPQTLTAETGRGWHLYFRYPQDGEIKNDVGRRLGAGLDVRGAGGYVVAPPSRHTNGQFYRWVDPDYLISNIPAWLLELLKQKPIEKHSPAPVTPLESGKASRYVEAALTQACAMVSTTPHGSRNATLNREGFGMGQLVGAGILSYYDAETRLLDSAQVSGLPQAEARATIQSALQAGQRKPRDLSGLQTASSTGSVPAMAKPKSKVNASNSAPAPALKTTSAIELLNREFQAPRWAIPNLLPQGLIILAGRPKCGKSWLAFDLCLAVARGGMALGNCPAIKGEALYLALEDSDRRLQDRLLQLITEGEEPHGLFLATESKRATEGGLQALDDWLDSHPACRLVVLDTLGRFRSTGRSHGDPYAEDTILLGQLQKMALNRGIALVIIHHTRKSNAENPNSDPVDDVLGSSGLTGAADSIWVLKRPRKEWVGQLFMTSRDVEEQCHTVEFERQSCTWHLQVEPEATGLSEERSRILDALKNAGAPIGPKEITDLTGLPYDSVRHLIRRMEAEGSVCRKARGKYEITKGG